MYFFQLNSSISTPQQTEYNKYLQVECDLFDEDRDRTESLLAISPPVVKRVLDVGCGAGQEMLPFIREKRAIGFGIDISEQIGEIGHQFFNDRGLADRVVFLRAKGEDLPFADESFEVVICRIALPYMNNQAALAEMTRVLQPNGVLFIKIHHLNYYFSRFFQNLRRGEILPMIHATRVISAGILFHLTGFQKPNRLIGNEVFQTTYFLAQQLTKYGMKLESTLSDTNSQTPSFAFVKKTPEFNKKRSKF